MRWVVGGLLSAVFCAAQIPQDGITAKLEVSITSTGALDGSMSVTASGDPSLPYLEAAKNKVENPALYGSFMKSPQLKSTAKVLGGAVPGSSFRILFEIGDSNFFLPIRRQQELRLDLVPFTLPAGAGPAHLREDISISVPPGFMLPADLRVTQETAFAQYRSEVKNDSGNRLAIVRELEIKQKIAAGSDAELEAFRKAVRDDQQRTFVLRRAAHVDLTGWIKSVPNSQVESYAAQAYQQREYDAARQLYERVLEAKPNDASAWDNLGRALAALGKLDDAIKAYEKSIEIDPKERAAYNNLGLVDERLGRWDKAVECFRKQIEVNPGNSVPAGNLPRALFEAGRWKEAEEAASKALQLRPDNATQRLNLAVAQVCQDKPSDTQAASALLNNALGPQPSAALLNNAAYYLTECGKQFGLAEQFAIKAVGLAKSAALASRDGKVSTAISSQISLGHEVDTYGLLLFKEGKIEGALNLLKAGVQLAPGGASFAHLAQAEAKLGHAGLATAAWREAVFLEPGLTAQVPEGMNLEPAPKSSLDREWYAVKSSFSGVVAGSLRTDQPCYFFVLAKADGSVEDARALDPQDAAAKNIAPAVEALTFPVVDIEGTAIPTVHVVRVVKALDGKVTVMRSMGAEAVATASDLAPGEFPLPASTTPAGSAAPANSIYRIGGGVSQPSITHKTEPQYAEEAHKVALAGMVELSCVIGSDGKPRDFKVLKSLGLGLDEKATDAVSLWEFRPGMKDGQPVAVYATIQVRFHIVGGSHSEGLEFQVPVGGSRPVIQKGGAPRLAGDVGATASLAFEVDEHGNPVNVRAEKASDEDWARAAVVAVEKWKFSAGTKDGNPVPVPVKITFVRQ